MRTPPDSKRHLKVSLKSAKKRTASSRRWLERQLNDPFVAMAQEKGYRSRAAFKLIEIDDKFHLFKRGTCVIDLGAAPGGWTQVVIERVAPPLQPSRSSSPFPEFHVVGIDLQDMPPLKGAVLLKGDFTDPCLQESLKDTLKGCRPHMVISDMAAPSCGISSVDHIRIMTLIEEAFLFAQPLLARGGHFVAKVLRGGTEHSLLKTLKSHFHSIHHFKPSSSRQESSEMYVVCKGYKEEK